MAQVRLRFPDTRQVTPLVFPIDRGSQDFFAAEWATLPGFGGHVHPQRLRLLPFQGAASAQVSEEIYKINRLEAADTSWHSILARAGALLCRTCHVPLHLSYRN